MLVEKYRPKSLDEIYGQDEIITQIKSILGKTELPHFLFIGPPGSGKTTTAECMAKLYFGEQWQNHYKEFNASDDRGINIVRTDIKQLTSYIGKRFIVLDEADHMTDDAQHALRRPIEKTSGATFIICANYEHKIIAPLKSRCAIFRFKKLPAEFVAKRLKEIMRLESIGFDARTEKDRQDISDGFNALVSYADGDLRLAINTLEKIIGSKKILTAAEVAMLKESNLAGAALETAVGGDFRKAQQLLEEAYIMKGLDASRCIMDMYNKINTIEGIDQQVRCRLYYELSKVEGKMKSVGGQPIVHLVGFLAYAWICPHLVKVEAVPLS